jgi:hypothetical protein
METMEIIRANLLSPLVLAFALGMLATLVKSDVAIPEPIIKGIGVYLLFSIGIRGGVDLANVSLAEFLGPALLALGLAVVLPTLSYVVLRSLGRFDVANAAAIAAHYGSVSSVTFVASISLLDQLQQPYEGFIPTMAALMEWGIVVALFIGRWRLGESGSLGDVLRETLTGRSVILLMGGLVIGVLIGEQGYEPIKPVFGDLFRGLLVLFILEMGMVAARQLREFAKVGMFMLFFGTLMPLINGIIGAVLGLLIGLSPGGAFVIGSLSASASYIDAPAAVRATLPQANPSVYLTSSLGITLPFNLLVTLPVLLQFVSWLDTLI